MGDHETSEVEKSVSSSCASFPKTWCGSKLQDTYLRICRKKTISSMGGYGLPSRQLPACSWALGFFRRNIRGSSPSFRTSQLCFRAHRRAQSLYL